MKLILVFMSILNITSQQALAAKIIGNVGDVYALEFVAIANETYDYMLKNEINDISLPQLKKAIVETKVESTNKKLSLNKLPKDAIEIII